ncbi:MAG TPA: hypothetical protein VFN67_42990 [Polyangiales bacterium]|nr:hypothetical protein [Polyangiales bacterium]
MQPVFVAWPAQAQTVHGGARVNTQLDGCVPIDSEQFHRVLAIELGTSIEYAPSAAQQPDGTVVRLVCLDGAVQLQLEDHLTRKSMQRLVELPAVDIATRSRLLALSVAEFVVASWVELRLAPPPLPAAGPAVSEEAAQHARDIAGQRLPAGAPPAEPAREPEPSAGLHWLLGVSFEPVVFSLGSGVLPQVSLHLEQRPNPHFALGLALSLGHANWRVRWPAVDAGLAQISSSSGRLTFAYLAPLGALELSVAAGARGGVVYMAGDGRGTFRSDLLADELYAPWGGPLLLLGAAGTIGSFRVGVELEAGYVTLPAQALIDGTVVAELGGFWGALGLGLGWLF